jgi:hypothetical protein
MVRNMQKTTVFIMMMILLGAHGAWADDAKAIVDGAGELVGFDMAAVLLYERCSVLLPDKKDIFFQKRLTLYEANIQIVQMAKDKMLAIIDVKEGKDSRAKAERYFETELPKMAVKQAADVITARSNPKAFCEELANDDPSRFYVSVKYPRFINGLVRYAAGYPWSLPACDYQVTFRTPPEITFQGEGETTNIRAGTPEKNSFPYIWASCWVMKVPTAEFVRSVKSVAEQQPREQGVASAQWTEKTTAKGFELTLVGYKAISGTPAIIVKTMFIGHSSALEILVTELAAQYPSLQTTEFFDRIELK